MEAHRIILRRPRRDDAEAVLRFGVSPEILRMYGGDPARPPANDSTRARRWVDALTAHPHAWAIEADGALAGQVRLDGVDEADRRARLAVGLLGEPLLGRGIGRAAIRLVLDHAFGPLALHRVDLRVLAFNERAIRCYRACGFVHEGTEREAALVAGERHDDWIMGILRHEHELEARPGRPAAGASRP